MSELPIEFKFSLPDDDETRKLLESYFNKGRINLSFTPVRQHIETVDDRQITVYDEIKINHLSLQPIRKAS